MKLIILLLLSMAAQSVYSTCSVPISRTNFSANSILTSTALNTQFNDVFGAANLVDGDCLTAATVPKAALATGATANLNLVAKTTTATLVSTDQFVSASTAAGAYTITLPTAVGNGGLPFFIKKTTNDTNVLTIDADGTETIDGELTILIPQYKGWVKLISNNVGWLVAGKYAPLYVYAASSGGEVLTGNTTNATFTEVSDTHAAWSGTTFTAPYDMEVDISGALKFTATGANITWLYVDTVQIVSIDSGDSNIDQIRKFQWTGRIAKGAVVSIRMETTKQLSASTTSHYITIMERN